jgi:Mrp family chromosome partitioning ATPase
MSDECNCNGTSCEEDCGQECDQCREEKSMKNEFRADLNQLSHVRHVIGIVSGKGGVGKSLVTSLLATQFSRKGYKTAVLDADITGPSIPKMFGVTGKAEGSDLGIFPKKTHGNISVMSINLLLDNEDAPVIWRGPLIAGTVKQFWTDVVWNDVDYMFIDMPPGTGDVPLTVFQSLPVDGIVVVTSPQDLVSLIVKKAANMAKMMNIPVLGLVENMSYYKCPDCGKKEEIFGKSKLPEVAADMGLEILGRMPIDSKLAQLCDEGAIERADVDYLNEAVDTIEKKLPASEG